MTHFVLSAFADEIAPDLETQLEVLLRHDIHHVEVRGVDGKGIVAYPLPEVRAIKRRLDERGVRVSAVGSPIGKIGVTDDFAPHLDLFRHTLDVARVLEAPYVRAFSFYIPQGEDPARYRDEVLRRWESFVKAAEGTGLVLAHENEKGIYGDTAERCRDLLTTLDCDCVRAVFDPANFVQCGVEPYPHAYGLLREHLAYFHVKDALYADGSVVPAGYGDGRLPELLAAARDDGFEGTLSLEPHLSSFTGAEGLSREGEALALSPALQILLDGESTPNGSCQFALAVRALREILGRIGR